MFQMFLWGNIAPQWKEKHSTKESHTGTWGWVKRCQNVIFVCVWTVLLSKPAKARHKMKKYNDTVGLTLQNFTWI